jgi:tetratricopeptide (TPR) repeat protein
MAALHAMAGNFDEAHRLVRASDELLGELGGLDSAVTQQEALVEMLGDRPAAAERWLRRGYERLEEMGEKALLATTAAMLAEALYVQGRHREAAAFCRVSKAAAAEDDLAAQVGWRVVRAKLLADEGHGDEAEALAKEAVRLVEPTDFLTLHAEALAGLAAVLRHGRRWDEADAAIRAALELYLRKGDAVSAAHACSLIRATAARQGANPQMERQHVQVRDGHAW